MSEQLSGYNQTNIAWQFSVSVTKMFEMVLPLIKTASQLRVKLFPGCITLLYMYMMAYT